MPKRTDIHSVLIIGAGPIIIGQACEFDYSGTQACKALREEGYRVILVNSNPATIMTDPEFADRTYIEPITPECIDKIIAREVAEMKRIKANGKLVLLPTLGGQTALNTAMALNRRGTLDKYGVEMIGANAEAIQRGEDRQVFKDLMLSIGLDVPISGTAHNLEEARQSRKDRPVPAHHPPCVHARRHRRRHRLQPRGVRRDGQARPRTLARVRDPHRGIPARLEGVRDGGHARPQRQLRRHLLNREL
jgi:hypothetical protein